MISLMGLDTIKVPGMTVNRYCSSGLETIAIANAKIQSGMADCIIAGGVESVLLDELKFTPSPGASYVLNKDVVRYYPSGSSIYSPSSGQRGCNINITGAANQWINPQSLRLVMTLHNTETNTAKKRCIPLRVRTVSSEGWMFEWAGFRPKAFPK